MNISFFASGKPKGQPRPAWLPIPSLDGKYEASADGRIRRSVTSRRVGNVVPGKVLGQRVGTRGYVHVQVCVEGIEKTVLAHRLVAEAFLGPAADNLQVNHKDGVKSNNAADNLEYVTARQNYMHAIATGLAPLGDRHGSRTKPESRPRGIANKRSKLADAQVIEIRQRRSGGETLARLAAAFGVVPQTIHNICEGKNWRHL